jgi:hypothetical protein
MTATYATSVNNLGIAPMSFIAGEAITANKCVKLHTAEGQVVHTTAITESVIGVALDTVASGEEVSVQLVGVVKCTASGAVTLGDEVMPTASGAGKSVTIGGATAKGFGVALQDAAGDGALYSVLIGVVATKTPASS